MWKRKARQFSLLSGLANDYKGGNDKGLKIAVYTRMADNVIPLYVRYVKCKNTIHCVEI